jgi:hypothetical protein
MFAKVVQLYRTLGRPSVTHNSFSYEGALTAEQIEFIKEVSQLPGHFGYFQTNRLIGTNYDVEYSLPASEHGAFYSSVKEFVDLTPSLNFGSVPKEFYIIDLDYYSGDPSHPEVIVQLQALCRFIKALSELAAEGGAAQPDFSNDNRLLFVLAADGKSPAKTLAVPVRVSFDLLGAKLAHARILELIVSDTKKNGIHMEERRAIMRMAIAEILSPIDDSDSMFKVLVTQWRKVLAKYHHNLLAFINQYSFEKVRKEIATAQVDHATKLSAVLGDIGAKLLALPVSFAAIILLRKASTVEEFWVIFAGMVTVSIIFVALLLNQWIQVERIRNSFDLVFGQYDDNAFPKKLRAPIASAKKNIRHQYVILLGTFIVFGVLAIVPAVAAIVIWRIAVPLALIDVCQLLAK